MYVCVRVFVGQGADGRCQCWKIHDAVWGFLGGYLVVQLGLQSMHALCKHAQYTLDLLVLRACVQGCVSAKRR